MTLRLALLGVAHVHAHAYATLLGGREDVELLGFCEEDPDTARAFSQASGLKPLPLGELLASGPQGVIVCSETARHLPLVQAAAGAGAHVLCEKPIAASESDALSMKAACEAAGVQFMTAFPARFSADVQALERQMRSGNLGAALSYSGVNHSVAPDREAPWFSQPALSGGGAGMDHIVHLADLLRFLGERPVEVYARLLPVPEWVLPEAAATDAAGLVTLRLESGATASIDCSWSRPPGYPRWGQLRLDVTASRGLVSLDLFAGHLKVSGARYGWAGYGPDLNALMLEEFLRLCRWPEQDGGPGRADWQDGYEALRVVRAAYASASSGQPVRLSPLSNPS
ncbi:Gfo/Idh/MocA family oxidoreductase (plasmid) [Deinococcus radiomollis]|uniref:Gfo/Idh/MocA family protein n=1 Tax=Deinococcus radiomollis TaxID=468916 RepID=UPI00389230DE